MKGYIKNYNFAEMECQKYYAPPASWSAEKKKKNAIEKIFGGQWLGAEKFDGYFSKVLKDEDGNVFVFSRSRGVNGGFAEKREWLPHLEPFFDKIPKGTCLLCELYLPSSPGSKNITTIMGCLKEKALARQEKGEKIHLYVFDCLAYNGNSLLDSGAKVRFNYINQIKKDCSFDYIKFASYYSGKNLWILLQKILGEGGEGIVICFEDGKYEPGKRPSKTTLKIKKELAHTIDCFFTGQTTPPKKEYTGKEIETWTYWYNPKTGEKLEGNHYKEYKKGSVIEPVTKTFFYGWAGSLEIGVFKDSIGSRVRFQGREFLDKIIVPIGYLSGLTEEIKAHPEKYQFKPIEVTAMEWDSENCSLRHGKFLSFRPDLNIEDCTLEKISD